MEQLLVYYNGSQKRRGTKSKPGTFNQGKDSDGGGNGWVGRTCWMEQQVEHYDVPGWAVTAYHNIY